MLDDFLIYVREQSLFQKNERILLAISGGVDSIVLAHLFHQSNLKFGIAHCNFSLRGEDSDKDQIFVEKMALNYGVPIHSIVFDTANYATKNKYSIQMAARKLRYQWFDQLIKEHSYKYLSTAHHHTDSIETVLFNFGKGTGISGVRGILPQSKKVIRPLLFASKKDIEQYAKDQHLKWREDASNTSEKYHRNYIRHNILPELEHVNPSFEITTKSTLERLKDAEEIVLAAINSAKEALYRQEGSDHFLDIDKLKLLPGKTTILHHLLKPFGFNYFQSKNIIQHISTVGNLFLSSTHQVNIDRTHIIISPLQGNKDDQMVIEKGNKILHTDYFVLNITECPVPKNIPKDSLMACFDLNEITFPLTIRKWKKGDRFYPLGMSRQKKISDFLIDEKVPLNLKDRVNVLISNDEIIWVMGHRIDNRYKISKATTQVLQVSLETKN